MKKTSQKILNLWSSAATINLVTSATLAHYPMAAELLYNLRGPEGTTVFGSVYGSHALLRLSRQLPGSLSILPGNLKNRSFLREQFLNTLNTLWITFKQGVFKMGSYGYAKS